MFLLKARYWIFNKFIPVIFPHRAKDENFQREVVELIAHSFGLDYKDAYSLKMALSLSMDELLDKFSKRRINFFKFTLLLMKILHLANGKPLAYLTRYVFFYQDFFYINSHVLIPRPETEELVDLFIKNQIIEKYQQEKKSFSDSSASPIKLLDIGTGSGNIAVSLKKKFPFLKIAAIDISHRALKVARRNARNILGSNHDIIFYPNSVFSPRLKKLVKEKFDIIITNPPYVGTEDADISSTVKRYEPRKALFSGKNGLDFFRRLAIILPCLLDEGGIFCTEIGYRQAEEVKNLFGYLTRKKVIADMQGKDRFICGYG